MTREEWIQWFDLDVADSFPVTDSYSSDVDRLLLRDGRTVFLKRPYTADKWYREHGWLTYLANRVAVPKILMEARPTRQTTGAFVLEALTGATIETVTPALAIQIGRLHATLHNCTRDAYGDFRENGFTAFPSQDWHVFRNAKLTSFQPAIQHVLSPALYHAAFTELERRERELPTPSDSVAIHLDFRLGNLLADGESLTGMIDFETARFGATEIDFTKLDRDVFQGGRALLDAYQDGYGQVRTPEPIEVYLPYYRLFEALTGIGWCVKRGLEHHQQFFNNNHVRLLVELERTSIFEER
ncbi:aminoglycoside phosphotransferase family protein [Exiguobacterium antarcticum]|uniref:Aminoglycoside phosphotransferase family protein n=1 Tax=Exiguobacterium antarcticum TaxID=132920 RepID=A0ABT6R1T8_9BACL|nr:aminoglycoside phosphotransferase family protein [Exiguobacterium antarcticum]MDI3234904.1 aminoglycoside phosphotransferase family protein [Exiguobacterium antarcticum]